MRGDSEHPPRTPAAPESTMMPDIERTLAHASGTAVLRALDHARQTINRLSVQRDIAREPIPPPFGNEIKTLLSDTYHRRRP